MSRVPVEYLPDLARRSRARVAAVVVDGWTVVALGAGGDPWRFAWPRTAFPVARLHVKDGVRVLTLMPTRQGRTAVVTTSEPLPVTTFSPDEMDDVGRVVLESLLRAEQATNAALAQVLDLPHLAHVDRHRLRSAIASPDDDGWFRRVLAVVGLPLLAADVAETRTEPDGALVLKPGGIGRNILQWFDLTTDEGLRGRRTPWLHRWYAAMVRHPLLMLLTTVPEVVLGVAGAVWAAQHPGGAYPVVVALVSVLMLVDAASSVLVVVRGRRRWPGTSPGVPRWPAGGWIGSGSPSSVRPSPGD